MAKFLILEDMRLIMDNEEVAYTFIDIYGELIKIGKGTPNRDKAICKAIAALYTTKYIVIPGNEPPRNIEFNWGIKDESD